MSLRILIDLQGAQNGSRYRGIGRYSLALAKGIARNAGEHRIFILLNGLFPDTIADIQSSFENLLPVNRFLIFNSPGPVAELTPENTWRRHIAEVLREYVIEMLSPDVLLNASMVEGAVDDTVISFGRLNSTVPTSAIIYDLIPMMQASPYFKEEGEKRWYLGKIDALRRVDSLFAISQSTMNDAIRLLGVDPTRIANISGAADSYFSPTVTSSVIWESIAERHGIKRKYLMHTSVFDARKNFHGLVRAYAALPRTIRSDYQLVLACKLDSSGREELTTLAKGVGLAPEEMVLTGFISDDDLIALYRACHLFVFPSFTEGFGLPALEAMSCGAPTIGSNMTSVPEVIGREDALFDPTSTKEMAALILKALTDINFYQSLKEHAKTQAAKFSWDNTASLAIDGMEKLVANPHSPSLPVLSEDNKRRNLLDMLAEISREFAPDDLAILNLARNIDSNQYAVERLRASPAFSAR